MLRRDGCRIRNDRGRIYSTRVKQFTSAMKQRIQTLMQVGAWGLVAMVLVATWMPLALVMPSGGLDPSWAFAMNEAVAQGLAFGREVVFTFGPYAEIYTRSYHPATDLMAMWGSALLVLTTLGALWVVANGASWWRVVLLAVVGSWSLTNMDAWLLFYPVVIAFAALTREPDNGRAPWSHIVVMLASLAGLSLITLIKGSMVPLAGLATAVIWFQTWPGNPWSTRVLVVLMPLASVLFFWCLAGQLVLDLPAYYLGIRQFIGGYAEAMSLPGPIQEIKLFGWVAALIWLFEAWQSKPVTLRWLARMTVLFMYFMVLFKAAFVRHDGHALIGILGLALVAAMLLLYRGGRFTLVLGLAAICSSMFMAAGNGVQWRTRTLDGVQRAYEVMTSGVGLRLGSSTQRLQKSYEHARESLRDAAGFPVLSGRSDVYPYHQSFLVASGNAWQPRPVMQSYAAYTEALADRNRQALLGETAPEHLFFRVEAIDGRMPSIEDGPSWAEILNRYVPKGYHNGFLLLDRGPTREGRPLELIQQGRAPLGQMVSLPLRPLEALYLRVNIEPTLRGAVTRAVFKVAPLQIDLEMADGEVRSFRLPANMAKSDFLASPLIETAEDFALMYDNAMFLEHRRVRRFAVRVSGDKNRHWQPQFSFEVRAQAMPSPRNVRQVLPMSLPLTDVERMRLVHQERCIGSLDEVNGAAPDATTLRGARMLHVKGWGGVDGSGRQSDAVFGLSDGAGQTHYFKAARIERPDVAAYLKNPAMATSGFSLLADVSALGWKGPIQVAFKSGDTLTLCGKLQVSPDAH